jgi:hypothetical protein
MRLPLSWLEEFVRIEVGLDEICRRLTMAGLEVESIDRIDSALKIKSKMEHQFPEHHNAESFSLTRGLYQPPLERISSFVGADDGHLYDLYYDGGWIWEDQERPPGTGATATNSPSGTISVCC